MSIWTDHGGALRSAKAAFPHAPQPWIDLSTGINPHPWPDAENVPINWHRLPEAQDIAALEARAAKTYGVNPRHICAVSGSEMAMRAAAPIVGDAGQYALPAYRTHSEMFRSAFPVASLSDVAPDLPLILANPANPSGDIHLPSALKILISSRPAWTLIDEAYADTDPSLSMANHIADDQRLIIFRSFGKFYGLAGLRLGFVLGPADFIANLRQRIGAWPVSAAAIAIGARALRDTNWASSTRIKLNADRVRLDALLAGHGLHAAGHCPLYRLVQCDDGKALFRILAQNAILTRPFADYPRWLRIGLPADENGFARINQALHHG